MKALIKSGFCLVLGWLAANAPAQDIQFRAFKPKNANIPTVANQDAPAVSTGASSGAGVTLSQPVPLSAANAGEPRPTVIRAQAPEITVQPGPLPLVGKETSQKPAPPELVVEPAPAPLGTKATEPKSKPKKDAEFKNVPATTPLQVIPVPINPVWDNLGVIREDNLLGIDGCCTSACGPICGLDSGCCQDRRRFWVNAEYLMFWQRSDNVPALVTSGPAAATVPSNGALGLPTTTILDNGVGNPMHCAGVRAELGMWFQRCPNLGIEVNGLFLGRESDSAFFSSNGNPGLYRPYFDAIHGQQSAELVAGNTAIPGNFYSGNVTVNHYSQLWGIEGNLRYKWRCGSNYWVDVLFGYRHLNLSEGIDITENLVPHGPLLTSQSVTDSFHTRSEFNGFQTGLQGEWRVNNRISIGATGKLAMGSTYDIININGTTNSNGTTSAGGLLALSGTNIGRYTGTNFAVLPEVGVKIGYNVTENLQFYVGYDFIYLSSVVRPGEQIDTVVNPNLQPGGAGAGGPLRPAVLFQKTDYFVQGLNFGLQYRY